MKAKQSKKQVTVDLQPQSPPDMKDKAFDNILVYSQDTLVKKENTIYDELRARNLLQAERTPGSIILMVFTILITGFINGLRLLARLTLVKSGQLGLSLDNGKPVFHEPGWYTFNSPFHTFERSVPLDSDRITCGNITIIKIPNDKVGITEQNGDYKLLAPGRHILESPQMYVKTEDINCPVIKAGSILRIRVEEGQCAVIYDNAGKTQILNEGIHAFNNPQIRFKEFLSTKDIVKRVEKLSVNTKDPAKIEVQALVTYRVVDPKKLVNNFQNRGDDGVGYEEGLFDRVEATLTNTFMHHSIDEIAPPLPDKETSPKGKLDPEEENDFAQTLRSDFMNALADKVLEDWGIELKDITIEKLEYSKELQTLFTQRAQENISTSTRKMNVDSQNTVMVKSAEATAECARIKAQGEADAMSKIAQVSKKEFGDETARNLAILKSQSKILRGAKCNFFGKVPNNISLLSGIDNGDLATLSAAAKNSAQNVVTI